MNEENKIEEKTLNEEEIINQAIQTQEENVNYTMDKQNSNYETNKEFVRDAKLNEKALKEKIETIITDIDDSSKKLDKRASKKNKFFIIAIILEVIVIALIVILRAKPKEKYTKTLECTNKTQELNSEYYIKLVNKYYFNKDDIAAKAETNVYYVFLDKSEYQKFKGNYKSTDVKDFEGLKQSSIFDDKNYVYNNKSVYNYKKLKTNKNVTEENESLIVSIPGKPSAITLPEQDYTTIKEISENMDFSCE